MVLLIICPSPTDPLHAAWIHCNNLIVTWLLKSISPSIASQVFFFSTAAQTWNVLQRRLSQPDDVKIYRLQQQLCMITQGDRSNKNPLIKDD